MTFSGILDIIGSNDMGLLCVNSSCDLALYIGRTLEGLRNSGTNATGYWLVSANTNGISIVLIVILSWPKLIYLFQVL